MAKNDVVRMGSQKAQRAIQRAGNWSDYLAGYGAPQAGGQANKANRQVVSGWQGVSSPTGWGSKLGGVQMPASMATGHGGAGAMPDWYTNEYAAYMSPAEQALAAQQVAAIKAGQPTSWMDEYRQYMSPANTAMAQQQVAAAQAQPQPAWAKTIMDLISMINNTQQYPGVPGRKRQTAAAPADYTGIMEMMPPPRYAQPFETVPGIPPPDTGPDWWGNYRRGGGGRGGGGGYPSNWATGMYMLNANR